jgi:hypothetical protein
MNFFALRAVAGKSIALFLALVSLSGIGPAPTESRKAPLMVKLVAGETQPLQGIVAIQNEKLGTIYPEGARTRLMLQTIDATRIVQVDHIRLVVKKLATPAGQQLTYTVDPRRQPGFGAAAPRKYNVVLDGETNAFISYIDEKLDAHPSSFPDLLPNDLPLLRLDAQSGFQEALDLNLKSSAGGLYEIRFEVTSMSGGEQYVQITDALRIFKQ